MTLKLYNTLTRQKKVFKPIDASNVRMYACGPTVYDFAHIGNARPVIVFDVLYRLLRHIYGAASVRYVRNITDVDDKINARAAQEHPDLPLNEAIAKVTSETTRQFHKDVAALGVLPPDVEPTCTGHIPQMVDMIEVLIEKGHAYEAERHVLLDVASIASYGELSRRSLDEMIAGARVEVAPYKKNPADSVLWKPSEDLQPGWPSPWGRGRPGWHIECSAMAKEHLGEVFDIHGGGIDLVFPHHENEIAQSRSAHGTKVMANVWMHNGFLQVEGHKMSKSLGNFVTIHDLLRTDNFGGRKWPGEVLKLAMLMTHYRQPIDWTQRRLAEAEEILNRWYRYVENTLPDDEGSPSLIQQGSQLYNDLDTPGTIQQLIAKARTSAAMDFSYEQRVNFRSSANILGLLQYSTEEWFRRGVEQGQDVAEIERLIAVRSTARAEKNWPEADRIRDQLDAMGIQLLDSKNPETGQIETTWEVKR